MLACDDGEIFGDDQIFTIQIDHKHCFNGEYGDLLTNEPNAMERLFNDTMYNGSNIN